MRGHMVSASRENTVSSAHKYANDIKDDTSLKNRGRALETEEGHWKQRKGTGNRGYELETIACGTQNLTHLLRYPFGIQQCLLPPALWFVRLPAPDRTSHFILFDTKLRRY